MESESPGVTTAAQVPGLLQSPTIGKLAEALAKAQGEMKAPPKTREVGLGQGSNARSYKYADLADVIEARRVGAKQGLAITQGLEMRYGCLALTTLLMHSSGEWKAWECPIPLGLKPQELGSYLTYMRRYQECGTWGIAAEDDDDGKRAQDAEPRHEQAQPVNADAAAIIDVAAELEQILGVDTDTLIKEASKFSTDEGAELWFIDPTDRGWKLDKDAKRPTRTSQPTAKWLKGVRGKLERDLQKRAPKAEPGAAEAAALFTASDADVPF